jgi:large subunit ribosomal protein L24
MSLVGKIKSPVKFLKSKLANVKKDKPAKVLKTPEEIEAGRINTKLYQVNQVPLQPRGPPEKFVPDSEADTGRNKAEPSPHTSSFYPTLVYPPFPSQLTSEIQDYVQETDVKERNEKQDWYEDGKEVTPEERAERKAAKAEKLRRKVVPDSMKTPLQLRWEMERRNKLAAAEKTKVDREALLIALGQHMEATRAAKKGPRRPATKQESVAELD